MTKRALISVWDKKGVVPLARALHKNGFEIVSTGGTAEALRKARVPVVDVSVFTGAPEILGGRVKTLHPKIFGGILSMPAEISVVVVNLYPFEEMTSKNFPEDEMVEYIDIGGVSLLRAAAKNFKFVTVVGDPRDYSSVTKEIEKSGEVSEETRRILARRTFEVVTHYDEMITTYYRKMNGESELMDLHYEKVRSLRYGENPHQKAAFFRNPLNNDANVTNAKVLQGKELSFNNILDADSAFEMVKEFEKPSAVFVKHNNPCGVASGGTIEKAFELSYDVDALSAFGAVVALNRPCNKKIAECIVKKGMFLELIICPSFDKDALKMLSSKKNLRLLETGKLTRDTERRDLRKVAGGILIQSADVKNVSEKELKVVTKKKPSKEQVRAMLFANKVAKHVMSNAIVMAKSKGDIDVVVGIGAGQMSRVDSVFMAAHKAGKNARGCAMASDAFFPFDDAVIQAVRAGVVAIIQPGGSVRDAEIFKTADKLRITMVTTGARFFRH